MCYHLSALTLSVEHWDAAENDILPVKNTAQQSSTVPHWEIFWEPV